MPDDSQVRILSVDVDVDRVGVLGDVDTVEEVYVIGEFDTYDSFAEELFKGFDNRNGYRQLRLGNFRFLVAVEVGFDGIFERTGVFGLSVIVFEPRLGCVLHATRLIPDSLAGVLNRADSLLLEHGSHRAEVPVDDVPLVARGADRVFVLLGGDVSHPRVPLGVFLRMQPRHNTVRVQPKVVQFVGIEGGEVGVLANSADAWVSTVQVARHTVIGTVGVLRPAAVEFLARSTRPVVGRVEGG